MKTFYKTLFFTALALAVCLPANSAKKSIVLDLTQPSNPQTFEYDANGVWTETYNDVDYTYWESQVFMFTHLIDGPGSSWGGIAWDGFTVSKNANSTPAADLLESQWGCMAGGGIADVVDGEVIVDSSRPYAIAYYSLMSMQNSLSISFNDGNTYTAEGMYVTTSPYVYYTTKEGYFVARPFTEEGDYLKIIAHGVKEDYSETTTEFTIAEFTNGKFSALDEWTWFDLSSLGEVIEIYFTMESTDVDPMWGMNTPGYFCMDRLTVSMEVEEDEFDGITLDLTQPSNPQTFEYDTNGVWTETYNDVDYTHWQSQIFSFSHLISGPGSSYGGIAWNGFTVSKNASDQPTDYFLDAQWGCMAKGGIAAISEGVAIVDNERPYIVANYSSWEIANNLSITFNDGNLYSLNGMYVTNSPYPYYTNISGDDFANPLTNEGDFFKIIAHGVKADNTVETAEFMLAEFKNGSLQQVEEWTWWDLSTLGTIKEVYFTMESSDAGQWGMNTPAYFCIDRIMASNPIESGIEESVVNNNTTEIYYSTNNIYVTATTAIVVKVYSINGIEVISQVVSEGETLVSTATLPNGIYIVKAGEKAIKFSK